MSNQVVLEQKGKEVEELKAGIQDNITYFTDFRGVSVNQFTEFRKALKAEGASLKVAKNTLIRRALTDLGVEFDVTMFEGPTAVLTTGEDPAKSAKILLDFLKEKEAAEVKGGVLESRIIEQKEVVELSKLPSREELIAKLVMVLQSPISGLVRVLGSPTRGLVYGLTAIKDKKEEK